MRFFVILLLGFIYLSLSAQIFPIGSRTITFNDPARSGGFGSGGGPGRQIQTEIYYPATTAGVNATVANGKFPVVVFGHGFVMTWDVYRPFYDSLARLGYICALPRTEGDILPNHTDFGKDLALVLDRLLAADTIASSPFFGKVNGRGAIGGHSMGGGASFLADQYTTNTTCYFTMAPAITNPSSSVAARTINKPVCILSGTRDCVAGLSGHQRPMYDSLFVSPCKQLVSITDARHCSFSNGNSATCNLGEGTSGCASSPLSTAQQLAIVRNIMIPYFNYYLKGICSEWNVFQNYITGTTGLTTQQVCNMNVPQFASIDGDSVFCSGNSANLSAQPTGFNYTWSNNASGQNVTISQPGSYSVSVSNSYCSINSTPFQVNKKLPPAKPSLQQNPNSFCAGSGNVTLVSSTVADADYYVWETPQNWTIVSNDSSNTLVLSPLSDGVVNITAVNECGLSEFDSLEITLNPKPVLSGTLVGATSVCINQPVQQFSISGSFLNADSLRWLANNWELVSGQGNNTASFLANSPTDLIQVYGIGICGNSDTASLAVALVDTLPITLSANGTQLNATPGFVAYQWFLNDTLIPGVQGSSITASSDGVYKVVGITVDSCSSTSNSLLVSTVSLGESESFLPRFYPNPAGSKLFLEFGAQTNGTVSVVDISGKVVLMQLIRNSTEMLNVENLSKGFYHLVFNYGKGLQVAKLVIE